jgi:glycosyltransferase involved in cell wall biosynthesis
MNPRTIVHVLRKFEPAEWGGIETHLLGLLPELASLGYRAEVHAPAESGTSGAPLRAIGVELTTFRARYPVLGLGDAGRRDLVAAGGNLVSFDELLRLARTRGAALFHAHTQRRLGGVVRTAARLRRVPYAVTIHGPLRAGAAVIAGDPRRRRGLDLGAPFGALVGARRVVEDADLAFVLNRDEEAAWADARRGRHLERVVHGVAPSVVTAPARAVARASIPGLGDAPYALVVGRLDAPKGQDLALEAFLRVADPRVHLVLARPAVDASFAKRLRARADAANVVNVRNGLNGMIGSIPRVHFAGGVAPAVARALMAEAELVLVPSRAEPFGIVLLEAWAEGTPAAFSAVGGLADLARDNDAGWGAVDAPTVDAWSTRLAALLADADGRALERREGPTRVARRYTWRALAERTADAYERAIASRRPSK